MAKKTFSDLQALAQQQAEQLAKATKLGTQARALVDYDSAIVGPLVIQHPDNRIMTGATSSAHAAEQISAVTAAGANRIRTITETGGNSFVN